MSETSLPGTVPARVTQLVQRGKSVVANLPVRDVIGSREYSGGGNSTYITMAEVPQPGEEGDGIVVLELCGGLAPVALALAVNGLKVKRVVYCDTSDEAFLGAAALHQRARELYPQRMPAAMERHVLPQDITSITAAHLQAAGLHTEQWLLVAGGWPCPDRSSAGAGAGIDGRCAPVGDAVHQIISTLNKLRLGQPHTKQLWHLVENVAVGKRARAAVLADQHKRECQFGKPLAVDSAQFDVDR